MLNAISKTIKWIGQHFLGMLFLLIAIAMFVPKVTTDQEGPENLQEIHLKGEIVDADEIVKEIEKAKRNPRIKGVLLTVNSPGGGVPPSLEIADAIRELKKVKPVIAYASGTMASGSYYSSIYANKIIANPGALIGSIGVVVQSFNIEQLMHTAGIFSQSVQKGRFKTAGTILREWTAEERQEIDTLADDAYKMFVEDVAEARGLDIAKFEDYADAHVFMAPRAKEVGLVDMVGTKRIAKLQIAELAKVSNPVWKEKSKVEKILEKLSASNWLQSHNGLIASFK